MTISGGYFVVSENFCEGIVTFRVQKYQNTVSGIRKDAIDSSICLLSGSCADDSRISVSSETINFMSDFYCYVFIGVIRQDISTRFSSDPEEILAGCQIMMESSIQKSLMKFAAAGK